MLIVNTPVAHAQIDVHTHANSPLNIHAQVHAPIDVDILPHVKVKRKGTPLWVHTA